MYSLSLITFIYILQSTSSQQSVPRRHLIFLVQDYHKYHFFNHPAISTPSLTSHYYPNFRFHPIQILYVTWLRCDLWHGRWTTLKISSIEGPYSNVIPIISKWKYDWFRSSFLRSSQHIAQSQYYLALLNTDSRETPK